MKKLLVTFFYLEGGTRTSKPACGSADSGERWVINNAWPAAKLQIAVLLSAALTATRKPCGMFPR
jgi:hypothetical protein